MADEGHEQDDAMLIAAYLQGDADSFNILYERYKRPLYAYLNKLLQGQSATADDVFQQTWLRAIDRLSAYRNQEKFLAWLMRIAHNLTIDLFRASTRRGEENFDEALPGEAAEQMAGSEDSPVSRMDASELAAAIDQAVSALPPELREVFLLRQEDIPFREIAQIQHCSINTCLARMQYALKKLRNTLSAWKEQTSSDMR